MTCVDRFCGHCVSRGTTRCSYPHSSQSSHSSLVENENSWNEISEPCTAESPEETEMVLTLANPSPQHICWTLHCPTLTTLSPQTSTPDHNHHHTGNFQEAIPLLKHADIFQFSPGLAADNLHPDLLGPLAVMPYIIAKIPLTVLTRNSMELIFRVMRT